MQTIYKDVKNADKNQLAQPRVHSYLLIDGALVSDLGRLVSHLAGDQNPQTVPLMQAYFGDQAYDGLPLLISSEPGSAVYEYFSTLLETIPAGCMIRSTANLETLAAHCSSLMRVTLEGQRPSLFRFYDPRNLNALVEVFSHALPTILGPMERLSWHHNGQWHQQQLDQLHEQHNDQQSQPWDGTLQPPGWLQIDAGQLAAITEIKRRDVNDQLALTYQSAIQARGEQPVAYVAEQLSRARQFKFESLSELERWLRLALGQGPQFWQQADAHSLLITECLTTEQQLQQLEQLFTPQSAQA
ncbi:MAG: hypothetical protein ACJAWL_002819 [Motiliproteus sp.]|jgi:hypothetical protein